MSRQVPLSKNEVWKTIREFVVGADGISGAVLVEFTILAPMVLAIAIYTMDFGLLIVRKIEVQNAAQAGIQYAIVKNGYDPSDSSTVTAISTAVTNATAFTAITPTLKHFCGCPSTTGITDICSPSTSCTCVNTCSNPGVYVSVTATPTTAYTPLIPYGLLGGSYDTSATSTVRIK